MIWSASSLSKALGVVCLKHLYANQAQFNSKDVQSGDLFIALKGAKNGHEFVVDAAKKGAGVLVINHSKFEEIELQAKDQLGGQDSNEYKAFIEKLILVEDTEMALYSLAKYKRDNSKAKFIAVTGSVGKTSTKEALNIILSKFGKCFASRGNFNNKLGLAINLASMPEDIDYAVLELGMNAVGEILELTKQVRPDIAAITSIFGVHLEYFESVKKIAEAKCEIFEGIDPKSGVAVLPADYEDFRTCKAQLEQNSIKNIKSFTNIPGINDCDAAMVSYEVLRRDVRVVFDVSGVSTSLIMPYIPKHIAGNFTLCLLIAKELSLDLNIAAEALKLFVLGIGRGRVLECIYKDKLLTIITDYYNSNPESLKCSLENLSIIADSINAHNGIGAINRKSRKLAIIGDMGELGEGAIDYHRGILEHVEVTGVEVLILVGSLARHIVDGYEASSGLIEVHAYSSIDELLKDINTLIKSDDLILIKASRFMQFERITKYLGIENAL